MPGIVAGALVAHPPILLAEVGGVQSERVHATADALHQLDGMLSMVDADLAVVISPHSPSSMTSLPVRRGANAGGNLARFRAPHIQVAAQVDVVRADALIADGRRAGFSLILLGAAQAAGLSSQVLSYEGPFGVGYPVVAFTRPTVAGAAPKSGLDIQALGRRAIDTYLRTRRLIEPPQPIPLELEAPSAAFV